jgi:MYXO-CTERM domain-containing protein
MAACSGECSVSCQKRCDVQLPKADCDAMCKASCDGSCTVDPNLDCQLDCQAKGYARCESDVTGGCKARCKTTEGALFCDGNYIDTGDKLQQCVDALEATLQAHVMASSSGSSSCDAGTCSAKGQARVTTNCSAANPGAGGSALPGILLLLGFGAVVRRRSRR